MARKTSTEQRIEELKALQAARQNAKTIGKPSVDPKPADAPPAIRLIQLVANDPLHCTDTIYRTALEAAAEWAVQ